MSLPFRGPQLADSRRARSRRARGSSATLLSSLLVVGCVSYENAPLDPSSVLEQLRAVGIPASRDDHASPVDPLAVGPPTGPATFDPADGLSVAECVAVALRSNPDLIATRARLGVAEAQLVLAGLLPDPTIGWDFNEDRFQFLLPILRPDERTARRVGAEAALDETRWEILRAEWDLGRRVHLAILDVLGARQRVRLNTQLAEAVQGSLEFFTRAHALGAATALDKETAAIQEARVRADGARLASEARRADLGLNALLGLPPGAVVPFEDGLSLSTGRAGEPGSPRLATEQALRSRPDLRSLLATYAQTEAALRLAVARQWPGLGIGTSVQLTIGVLSDFNQPAIDVAFARRERVRQQFVAAVHAVRAEVHDAFEALNQSRAELDVLTGELAPRLAESLRLMELAAQAGQATSGEILVAQGQVIEARVRSLEVEIEAAKRVVAARWIVGDVQEEAR